MQLDRIMANLLVTCGVEYNLLLVLLSQLTTLSITIYMVVEESFAQGWNDLSTARAHTGG